MFSPYLLSGTGASFRRQSIQKTRPWPLSEQEMPKLSMVDPAVPDQLRLYRSRFAGPVLLACGKCQKKLKRDKSPFKLKKALKGFAKSDGSLARFAVVKVSCMKLCPKDGIAVCPPTQLMANPPLLHILRSAADLEMLIAQSNR